jgi:hypothetical protein
MLRSVVVGLLSVAGYLYVFPPSPVTDTPLTSRANASYDYIIGQSHKINEIRTFEIRTFV